MSATAPQGNPDSPEGGTFSPVSLAWTLKTRHALRLLIALADHNGRVGTYEFKKLIGMKKYDDADTIRRGLQEAGLITVEMRDKSSRGAPRFSIALTPLGREVAGPLARVNTLLKEAVAKRTGSASREASTDA